MSKLEKSVKIQKHNQSKLSRLRKKVSSFKDVIATWEEENLVSENTVEVLSSVPDQLHQRSQGNKEVLTEKMSW